MERKNRMEASPLKQKVRLHTCMKLTLLMWIMVEYMLSAMNIDALAAKKVIFVDRSNAAGEMSGVSRIYASNTRLRMAKSTTMTVLLTSILPLFLSISS